MTCPNPLRSPLLLGLALLLGLPACKPSAPPLDASAAPPAGASATERAAATVDSINPVTSPREAVLDAMHKLMNARSYHASMQFDGGPKGQLSNEVDFVAPDRMRMQMAGMGTQVVVGDTMYMSMEGRTMQVPMPKGTLTQWRDPGNLREAEAGMTAEAQGRDVVDGVPARKYLMHYSGPNASDATLWIGPSGLPLKMQVTSQAEGKHVTTTIRYSRINDPTIRIDVPK